MRKYWILIFTFVFFSFNFLLADGLTEFKKANDFFNNGDYENASKIYNSLLDSGYFESEIYYNLGNSYYRMDSIPESILNYERAKRLSPSDDDIDFNLKLANLKIVDKFEPVPKLFFLEWFDIAISLLYSGTWGYVIVAMVWVFFISLLCLLLGFLPKFRTWFVILLLSSFFISSASILLAYKAYEYENSNNSAIIFTPSVYVKSAPDPGSTDLFILHEGTKIQIMDAIDKWIQIKAENGSIGWINEDDIEII